MTKVKEEKKCYVFTVIDEDGNACPVTYIENTVEVDLYDPMTPTEMRSYFKKIAEDYKLYYENVYGIEVSNNRSVVIEELHWGEIKELKTLPKGEAK